MNIEQYELLKQLVNQTTEEEFKENALSFLKYDLNREITVLLIGQYRKEITTEIAKRYSLDEEERENCYFKVLTSLYRSVKESRFKYKNEKSVKNYLFVACKGAAIRLLAEKGKTSKSDININELLKYQFVTDGEVEDREVEYKNMQDSIFAALEELPTNCKEIIQKYYFEGMSHAQIVELMPQLLNVKNSNAKAKRCLDRLKIKAVNIYRNLESRIET